MADNLTLWPTLTIVVGITAWLLGTKLRQGRLISPFSVTILLLVAIYGVRPLMMVAASRYNFYGFDVMTGFHTATIIGFVSVLSLGVGYLYGSMLPGNKWGSRRAGLEPGEAAAPMIVPMSEKEPAVAALAALSLLTLWIVAMSVLGGGLSYIFVLFAGRSSTNSETFLNVPALVPALPVVAALTIALTRFRFERWRVYSWQQSVIYWIVIALCVVPPSALGTRRFLIPSVVAALLGASGPNWIKLLKLRWLLFAAVGFIALAIIPFVRSSGSRTGDTSLVGAMREYFDAEGVQGILNSFFLSYDTEMFNYVSYLAPRLGNTLEYGFGRGTIGEAFLAPVPAGLLPFPTWSNQLLIQAFGGTCAQNVCPVPSVVGTLYYDLAFPGIVIGMLLIGMLCSRFEKSLFESRGYGTAVLLLLGGFATVIVRGNPISQLWIAAQCLVVLLAVDWAVRRIASERAPTRLIRRQTVWLRPQDEEPYPVSARTRPH
jgi:hypothetical protein